MANLHQPWMQRTGAGSPSRLPPLGDAGDGSGRLEGLLSAVDDMDSWDGDGVFSDEKKGKKKKGKKKRGGDDPSADQPAAFGGTSGAADPSVDMPAAFGGTSVAEQVERERRDSVKLQPPELKPSPPTSRPTSRPQSPTAGVSDAVAGQVEKLTKALEATKQKLQAARAQASAAESAGAAEAERLRAELEAAMAEKKRAESERAEAAAAMAAAQKKRRGGRAARASAMRASWDDDDDEDGPVRQAEEAELGGCERALRQLGRRWRKFEHKFWHYWCRLWPLQRDISWVEARYGQSVSIYFVFAEWMCVVALIHALLWLVLLVPHVVALAGGYQPTDAVAGAAWLPRHLFFSAFRADEAVLYTVAIYLSLAWYAITGLSYGAHLRRDAIYEEVYESDTRQMRTARLLFTSWDSSVADGNAERDARLATRTAFVALKHEKEWRRELAARPIAERRVRQLRQVGVVVLHIAVLAGIWAALVWFTASAATLATDLAALGGENTTIASVLAIVPAVVIALLGTTLQTLAETLSKQAKWDNPRYTRTHMLAGFFLGRILTILLILLGYYEFIVSTPLIGGLTSVTLQTGYSCGQDQLGGEFAVLILSEFVVPKVSLVGAVGAKRLYAKVRKKEGASAWRKVFALEKNVIHLIYFQALLWMITPYWPFAALLAPILLVLDYKWETFSLVRFCKRSATPLADAHKSASLLLGLYLLCLLLFCTAWGVAWLVDPRMTASCGPFAAGGASPAATMYAAVASAGTLLLWLYTFSISPYFLWAALCAAAFSVALWRYRARALTGFVDEQRAGFEATVYGLQSRLRAQEKQVAFLKRQEKLGLLRDESVESAAE